MPTLSERWSALSGVQKIGVVLGGVAGTGLLVYGAKQLFAPKSVVVGK